ncbi:hypothetical protein BC829DRAFT_399247 [Chytridium lagenaria]|nr:hypothetical protein BC829DRAFT_399247 [Chytridium lagenaria]
MLHILNGTMEEIPSRPVTPRPTSLLRRRSSVLPVAKSTPLHLDVKDLMFEALHKIHPVTFGDVRVLTAQEAFGACASIDYVLCMRRTGKVGELQRKVVVDLDASRVEKFAVANEPFTHISDHYGFSTVLRILEA